MYFKKIEIYPYIELMLNIYIHNDELNIKLNRNMTMTFEEDYFIIKKNGWINLNNILIIINLHLI